MLWAAGFISKIYLFQLITLQISYQDTYTLIFQYVETTCYTLIYQPLYISALRIFLSGNSFYQWIHVHTIWHIRVDVPYSNYLNA